LALIWFSLLYILLLSQLLNKSQTSASISQTDQTVFLAFLRLTKHFLCLLKSTYHVQLTCNLYKSDRHYNIMSRSLAICTRMSGIKLSCPTAHQKFLQDCQTSKYHVQITSNLYKTVRHQNIMSICSPAIFTRLSDIKLSCQDQ
jgi:hypothetical protein